MDDDDAFAFVAAFAARVYNTLATRIVNVIFIHQTPAAYYLYEYRRVANPRSPRSSRVPPRPVPVVRM